MQHLRTNREGDRLGLIERGSVGWAGNSGFHMLNLAVQMQPRRVALVGFDMRVDHGLHWHGSHPEGLSNPTAANTDRWRRCTDAVAEPIAAMGVEVVNCSPISALRNYRFADLEEALEC
ncbi:hypothetical protein PVT71_14580 [Salipiger sp. H15]|uniref:Uncharacterized protein n=1 Tax=Alloyangia sp. H15 TaxID=3029062 RepID=A0AAU8ALU0_9RHOB